jgi:hypothetical protein
MAFAGTLTPPPGKPQATRVTGRSGLVYEYLSNGNLTVTDELDFQALVGQGWTVVSVSGGD